MPIKLNNGDIVTVSHTMPYLHILKKNNSDWLIRYNSLFYHIIIFSS
jgi:hypothetical protein